MHVVLLGDSIFDNASYVTGGPDVIAQMRETLPPGAKATLCAVDGDTSRDVVAQLGRVPSDATHLVVSAGGNDALMAAGVLMERANSVAEALLRLSQSVDAFERDYSAMLRAVLSRNLPTAVCTVYNPRFPDALQQRVAVAGLCLWNDAIIRHAAGAGVPIIDLRRVCDEAADYANEIEPSSHGGAKIARVIAQVVTTHNFQTARTAIYS